MSFRPVVRYLAGRITVSTDEAEVLLPFAISAVEEYVIHVWGYNIFEECGITSQDIVERLERPYIFGIFCNRVLDGDIDSEVKSRVAENCFGSIDPMREEGIPRYLFRIVRHLVESGGMHFAYIEPLIHLGLETRATFDAPFVVKSKEWKDVEYLLQETIVSRELDVVEKTAFLLSLLNNRQISSTEKSKLIALFLNCKSIPIDKRKGLALSFIEGKEHGYLMKELKDFLPFDFFPSLLSPRPILDIYPGLHLVFIPPSLARVSMRWIIEHSDIKCARMIIEKYFSQKAREGLETFRSLGILDGCSRRAGELGEDFSYGIFKQALSSNRKEVRELARSYLQQGKRSD